MCLDRPKADEGGGMFPFRHACTFEEIRGITQNRRKRGTKGGGGGGP